MPKGINQGARRRCDLSEAGFWTTSNWPTILFLSTESQLPDIPSLGQTLRRVSEGLLTVETPSQRLTFDRQVGGDCCVLFSVSSGRTSNFKVLAFAEQNK